MKPLVNNQPAPDETWEELAEYSLLHDNIIQVKDDVNVSDPNALQLRV